MKVCQCWDDGVLNDVKVAELCRKYNAKATFNLNPAFHYKNIRITETWKYRPDYSPGRLAWSELKSVFAGFEVASHGMGHLDATMVDAKVFVADAVAARNVLEDYFQKECRGFAWPSGRYTLECCQLMHEAGFAYGRTVENVESILPCQDFLQLSCNCHFQNPDFWNIFEKARPSGVFYFWGHSYEMMEDPVLWAEYEDKLRRLNDDPEVEWINVIDLVSLT